MEQHIHDGRYYTKNEIDAGLVDNAFTIVEPNVVLMKDLVPNVDNTRDLGTTSLNFKDIHARKVVSADDLTLDAGAGKTINGLKAIRAYDAGGTKYTTIRHDGTDGFVESSSGIMAVRAATQIYFQPSATSKVYMATTHMSPLATNDFDLGQSTLNWKDIHVRGVKSASDLGLHANGNIEARPNGDFVIVRGVGVGIAGLRLMTGNTAYTACRISTYSSRDDGAGGYENCQVGDRGTEIWSYARANGAQRLSTRIDSFVTAINGNNVDMRVDFLLYEDGVAKYPLRVYTTGIRASGYESSDGSAGISTTFTNGDGDTVTVKNGIITSIA